MKFFGILYRHFSQFVRGVLFLFSIDQLCKLKFHCFEFVSRLLIFKLMKQS